MRWRTPSMSGGASTPATSAASERPIPASTSASPQRVNRRAGRRSGCVPVETPPPQPNLRVDRATGGSAEADPFTVPAASGSTRFRVQLERLRGGQTLIVAAPLDEVDDTLHQLLLVEAVVAASVLAAILLVGLWLVRVGLRPLGRIEATAAAIAGGDLSQRIENDDPRTEVGRLGGALNTMLGQIEEAFDERTASEQRLRRFVADASHELRTPLAAVRAYAELFDRGARERPDDLERAMTGIQRESRRMGLLVDDLLLLARLDQGRPLERKPVELGDIARDAVESARTLEPERPLELEAWSRWRSSETESGCGRSSTTSSRTSALIHPLVGRDGAGSGERRPCGGRGGGRGPGPLRGAARARLRAFLPGRCIALARCRRRRARPRDHRRDRRVPRGRRDGLERGPRRRHRPHGADHDPPGDAGRHGPRRASTRERSRAHARSWTPPTFAGCNGEE